MLRPALNSARLLLAAAATPAKTACQSKIPMQPLISRALHLTSTTSKSSSDRRDLRSYRLAMPHREQGTEGENVVDIDAIAGNEMLFPDVTTPNKLFDGIPYKELPIFNIKSTKNNTIMTLSDFKGKVHVLHSCGLEGFKNAKKGTNVAAQTAAIAISAKALQLGVRTVRVRVQGIGPGRMSSIKGLQIGGINIVSITDNTHVSWCPPRPRKQRRV